MTELKRRTLSFESTEEVDLIESSFSYFFRGLLEGLNHQQDADIMMQVSSQSRRHHPIYSIAYGSTISTLLAVSPRGIDVGGGVASLSWLGAGN